MQITLLQLEPIEKPVLGQDGQAELFNHLLQCHQAGTSPSMAQLVNELRCKSPLPIISRLKHLQENGLVTISA